jgi:type IV pilus assembly protein PilA
MQRLRERMARDEGFTLIELLVVMLIIAILAALAIPSFFNQRNKARDADAKADARTAQTAMETYATENNGAYTGATAGAATDTLNTIEPTLNGATLSLPVAPTGTTYSIRVVSGTGTQFNIARLANGTFTYTCSPAGGGCPTGGTWN